MLTSYDDSLAAGTAANRLTQAKTYLTFAVLYTFDPLRPSGIQACMYVQYLKNSFASPTSVKNYLSGARSWIAEHGGDLASFASFEYQRLTTSLTKRSQHVPSRAAPLTWYHIKIIVDFLDATPGIPLGVKPCILIGYHTFLRSSNLLSTSSTVWGGPHTLSVQDLTLLDPGLEISVRTTKTKSDSVPVKSLIPWAQDPRYCPASAWFRYISIVRPWALGPAFVKDDHLPLTARHLVGFMRLALKNCTDIIPAKVSMHSLRRGAAQAAAHEGVPLHLIKEKGMWRSDTGIAPYLV